MIAVYPVDLRAELLVRARLYQDLRRSVYNTLRLGWDVDVRSRDLECFTDAVCYWHYDDQHERLAKRYHRLFSCEVR